MKAAFLLSLESSNTAQVQENLQIERDREAERQLWCLFDRVVGFPSEVEERFRNAVGKVVGETVSGSHQ